MKSENQKKDQLKLTLFFSGTTFLVLFITLLAAGILLYLLSSAGIVLQTPQTEQNSLLKILLFIFLLSNLIGLGTSWFFNKIPLKPIEETINGINELASGDYKIRMSYDAPFRDFHIFRNLSESMNKLAEELDHTEMLRSDFINNFSHEFKTPIVSIAGFAKLLQHGNLDETQKQEYLGIIEKESLRLSAMATNMLQLTRVENQAVLTDIKTFNLSEQLRDCILLLVDKWESKNLEIQADFEEYKVDGNPELLRQVWINLIDNAIKFSPEWGTIAFTIHQKEDRISVSILNSGPCIPPEKQDYIFNKFYQADESHAQAGNGIGLAIVKKVVQLHKGTVKVTSENEITVFTVELPMTF